MDEINEKASPDRERCRRNSGTIQGPVTSTQNRCTEQVLDRAANVDDLTDVSAQKCAELDMCFRQDTTRIENSIAELDQTVRTCVAHTDIDSQLAERIWADFESRVHDRVNANMRDLSQETLRGALVPFAANFENKMAEFESRILQHTKIVYDT